MDMFLENNDCRSKSVRVKIVCKDKIIKDLFGNKIDFCMSFNE